MNLDMKMKIKQENANENIEWAILLRKVAQENSRDPSDRECHLKNARKKIHG